MTDVEKVGPVDHITRVVLPWRSAPELTECGKPVTGLTDRLVTRAEAASRIQRVGKQRAAFSLCMTCASTSDRQRNLYGHTEDPVGAVARATGAVRHAAPPWNGRDETKDWRERERLTTEFEAIAALIAAHRDEFDGYLSGREQTVSLADRRRLRRG